MKFKKYVSKKKDVIAIGTILNAPIGEKICENCQQAKCSCNKLEKLITKLKIINSRN